jgi:hypothetical protein
MNKNIGISINKSENTRSGVAGILSRFPHFELSYETISHRKVSEPYDVALAIPLGKKYYIWTTFEGRRNVCYLMEITRDKRIGNITEISIEFAEELSFGTVLYGTIGDISGIDSASQNKVFIIEDIFYHHGISVKHHTFSEKLGAIDTLFSQKSILLYDSVAKFSFGLPVMWKSSGEDTESSDKQMIDKCGYTVHHIQYRSLTQIVPYINMSAKPKPQQHVPTIDAPVIEPTFHGILPTFNYTKPQYKHNTVFIVKADIQFDIYHLYAYGANKSQVYCGLAGIPTYKTSVCMNGLFRNIRENKNIDYIEESDDEEDFENTQLDKYVSMDKIMPMECYFHKRFKKWVPLHVVPHSHLVVHINKL